MKIEFWKTSQIKPYENNPRQNNAAVEKVAISIEQYGWQQPIVVDSKGVIIVGHTRLKAAEKLGLDKCPVVVAKDLTPAQVKAYRIADNKTGELAIWDDELLKLEIDELIDLDFDVELTGFDLDELGIGIEEIEYPELPEGDKSPFQQMTFTLSDHQAETIKKAMRKAKDMGPFVSENENGNGNAIARIAEAFIG